MRIWRGMLGITIPLAGLGLIQDRGPHDLTPINWTQNLAVLAIMGLAAFLLAVSSDKAIARRHRRILNKQVRWLDGYETMPTSSGQPWRVAVPRHPLQY